MINADSWFSRRLQRWSLHVLLFLGTRWLIRSSGSPNLELSRSSYPDLLRLCFAGDEEPGALPGLLVDSAVLSFPLFLIPRLFISDFPSYRIAFAAEMLPL